jgi:hypothetical protein
MKSNSGSSCVADLVLVRYIVDSIISILVLAAKKNRLVQSIEWT